MKLVSARVTNFRSVEDSGEFNCDQITCLVGKNEAGKSALLTALAVLNPHSATPMALDKERDYPRRFLTQYAERHKDGEAKVIDTVWKLSERERELIKSEFGDGALKTDEISVCRKYGSAGPEWHFEFEYVQAIKNLFERFSLDATERAQLKSATSYKLLLDALKKIPEATVKQKQLLDHIESWKSFTSKATSLLSPELPKFMYFASYDRMAGAVQIEQMQQLIAGGQINTDEHKGIQLFNEFLTYAGVPVTEVLAIKTYETFNARLQGASNNITDQILEYWTQNPYVRVEVKIETGKPGDPTPFNTGTIARARIHNELHRADTPFSERSAGFVWFFSFLIKFAQIKKDGKPVILLLDEPGLTLHGKAQGDLLHYFDEKLAPFHQIVYSTHSPFMVAPDRLLSARIVEDVVERKGERRIPHGTKVYSDVLSTDPDTLFPLQGALGYEITQTLFIGKHTLLVEGPSDIVYLNALSTALKKVNREGLDSRWVMCPSGGVGNIRPFVSLFGGNKLDITVLADYAAGVKRSVETLRTSQLLASGRVLLINEFCQKPEGDTEDLFEPQVLVDIVNAAYGLSGDHVLTVEKLEAVEPTTPRLVQKLEAYFRVKLPPESPEFDHFRPAEWLMNNLYFLGRERDDLLPTLERAESLFRAINKTLEQSAN